MHVTALDIALRFKGVREIAGARDDPFIRWCHSLTDGGESPDEVAWCSSFAQVPAFLLDLPRTKSKRARSWLFVDAPAVSIVEAVPGFDIVILKRGPGGQPGPDVLDAPGHVTFFAGRLGGGYFDGFGGNQGNAVGVGRFPVADVLGVRRLHP